MKLNRVLIVVKRDIVMKDGRRGKAAHLIHDLRHIHDASLAKIEHALSARGIAYRISPRDKLRGPVKADLIITAGGDGTVLAAARSAGNVPIFGVNSMPEHSVGFFCGANAHNFEEYFDKICGENISPTMLPMVDAFIDGKNIGHSALNDFLFAGTSPAETVRYVISSGGAEEFQRSSGIWVAAGPGSSAAISSAGGLTLALTSNKIQFAVREPYAAPGKNVAIRHGAIGDKKSFHIISNMAEGRLYIDGAKWKHTVFYGSKLTFGLSKKSVKLFLTAGR